MRNTDKGAIALEYGKNEVPIISAKGEAELAEIIIEEAKKQGLEISHRSDILSLLISQQPSILIAGSHGKTTTSTILTTLLALSKKDPTAIVGGIIPLYKNNGHAGEGKYLVAEVDESDGTLIKFKGDIGS